MSKAPPPVIRHECRAEDIEPERAKPTTKKPKGATKR